jgi:hypothetical protein
MTKNTKYLLLTNRGDFLELGIYSFYASDIGDYPGTAEQRWDAQRSRGTMLAEKIYVEKGEPQTLEAAVKQCREKWKGSYLKDEGNCFENIVDYLRFDKSQILNMASGEFSYTKEFWNVFKEEKAKESEKIRKEQVSKWKK